MRVVGTIVLGLLALFTGGCTVMLLAFGVSNVVDLIWTLGLGLLTAFWIYIIFSIWKPLPGDTKAPDEDTFE